MFFTPLLQGGSVSNSNSAAVPKIDAVSSIAIDLIPSMTWTHTPVGNPSAVIIFTWNNDYATTSVTYGGKSLSLVTVSGQGYCWVSSTALPTGPQTIVVTFAAGTSAAQGLAYSLVNTSSSKPIRSFSKATTANPNTGGLGEIYLDIPASDLGICAAGFANLSGAPLSPTDGSIVDFTIDVGRTFTFVHKSGLQSKFNFAAGGSSTSPYSLLALSIQPATYKAIIPQVDAISYIQDPTSNVATYSWTHTPTQKPSAVVVFTHHQNNSTTSVTYGGVALNLVKSRSKADTGVPAETGYCWASNTALPAGPQTVVVTYSGSVAGTGTCGHIAVAYTLFNSSTTNPVRSTTSTLASAVSNAGQLYLDIPAGDLGICGAGFSNIDGADLNPTDGKTKNLQTNAGPIRSSYVSTAGPQSSFSFARSYGTSAYPIIAASIQPATSVLARRLTNVGNLLVNGYFDEVTKTIQSTDVNSIQYSARFDETAALISSIVTLTNAKTKRHTQPRGVTQIDWTNPITNGLVAAINPASPSSKLIRVGSPVYTPTAYGTALKNPNDTTVNGLTTIVPAMGSAATIVSYCTMPRNLSAPFIVGGFGNNGAGSQIFCFQSGNTGATLHVRAVIRTVDLGGINTAETVANDFPIEWSTIPSVWVGVYDGTSNLTLYRNGVDVTAFRINDAASGSISTLDNFSIGFINRGADVSSGPNTQNLLGLGFNRALNAREIRTISANPWQIFKPINKYNISISEVSNTVTTLLPQKTKHESQPQTPKLLPRYAGWEWVYVPTVGVKNLGSAGISGVFTGSAGYGGTSPVGKSYALGANSTSSLRLGDTTCKFVQTKPVSGLIVFTRPSSGANQPLFRASTNYAGLYVKVNNPNQIEIDTTFSTFILGSTNLAKTGGINIVAFCIEPRVADGGTGRISIALNGVLTTGTWTSAPNFTGSSDFGSSPEGFSANQQMLSCATTASISNAELVRLSNNPWSIFKPVSKNIISVSAPPLTLPAQQYTPTGGIIIAGEFDEVTKAT